MIIALVAALLSGVTRTVGRMANAQLAQRIGSFQSTFYNYLVGLLCSLLALAVLRAPLPLAAVSSGQIPAWAYLGGGVGVLFIVLSNMTAPKISAFAMTLLIFVGQIATGIAIDALVHQRLVPGKVAGGGLILAGLVWNQLIARDPARRRGEPSGTIGLQKPASHSKENVR
jgi:bacterial/archaeal transporter family-2 protein